MKRWTPDPTQWNAEPGGWYQHQQKQPWHTVALPKGVRGWWYRLTHRCTPHSAGVYGWEVAFRCICGAIRQGVVDPVSYMRHRSPATQALDADFGPWIDRNSRHRDTAVLYYPHMATLTERTT